MSKTETTDTIVNLKLYDLTHTPEANTMEIIVTLFVIVAGVIFFGWIFTVGFIGYTVLNPKAREQRGNGLRDDHMRSGGTAFTSHAAGSPPVGSDPSDPIYAAQHPASFSDSASAHSQPHSHDAGSRHHHHSSAHDSAVTSHHSSSHDTISAPSPSFDAGSVSVDMSHTHSHHSG